MKENSAPPTICEDMVLGMVLSTQNRESSRPISSAALAQYFLHGMMQL